MHERTTFRSKIAYVHLVAIIVLGVLVALAAGAAAGGIVAAVGLVWVLLTWRSRIDVTDEGFKIYRLLGVKSLDWSQADAFIVVSYAGTNLPDYGYAVAPVPGIDAVSSAAIANRQHMFALIAVVDQHGERVKILGTASSFVDPGFPAGAALELNRILKRNNPTATAS